jgi:hypothetical protein
MAELPVAARCWANAKHERRGSPRPLHALVGRPGRDAVPRLREGSRRATVTMHGVALGGPRAQNRATGHHELCPERYP